MKQRKKSWIYKAKMKHAVSVREGIKNQQKEQREKRERAYVRERSGKKREKFILLWGGIPYRTQRKITKFFLIHVKK